MDSSNLRGNAVSGLTPLQAEGETATLNNDMSELALAAQKNDLDSQRKLLAHVPANERGPDGSIPLQWAAQANRWEACELLLNHGADPNLKTGNMNATALHWACRNGLTYISRMLISNGASIYTTDDQGSNALHVAVHSSNVLLVIYLILVSVVEADSPADGPLDYINLQDARGLTALHWAAYQGDHLTVKCLLRHGAKVNIKDNDGFEPLHWALVRASQTCIELLLVHGADPHAETNAQKSAFEVAKDMKATCMLGHALAAAGYNAKGEPLKRYFSLKVATALVLVTPTIVFGISLYLVSSIAVYFSVPLTFVLCILGMRAVNRFVLKPFSLLLIKSPLLAGVFLAVYFWTAVLYSLYILPTTWTRAPIQNTVFIALALVTIVEYVLATVMDPGIIRPGTRLEMHKTVCKLMDEGKFSSQFFCTLTWALKPARAEYTRYSEAVIARFDHYCPWINNSVGLGNHRTFVIYIFVLTCGMIAFSFIVKTYLYAVSPNGTFFAGVQTAPAVFELACMCAFQLSWTLILLGVQSVQIARGLTSHETAQMGKRSKSQRESFDSLPEDHPKRTTHEPAADTETLSSEVRTLAGSQGSMRTCIKLLGLNQVVETSRAVLKKQSGTDFGIWRNCSDFWAAPLGEALLNGERIDYFTQLELPSQEYVSLVSSCDVGDRLRRLQ